MTSFNVVYSERQVCDALHDPVLGVLSPSASKPRLMAAALERAYPTLPFIEPPELTREDFYLAHSRDYVDGVLEKRYRNGFGTKSDAVNASLPFTSGAMWEACATATAERPCAALVSGFHHAGWDGWDGFGHFCTFNGLMVSALKHGGKVMIIDCDMHWGNGTDDIIRAVGCSKVVVNRSFGLLYSHPRHASDYLAALGKGVWIDRSVREWKPDLIIYQAGADVHVDDPFGGVLTEAEMVERDRRVFRIAKASGVPVAWCLAGGYQVDPDGGIDTILRLHLNTFRACEEVYG